MDKTLNLRAGIFLVIVGFLPVQAATAQVSLGVHWSPPEQADQALGQLGQFKRMGITHLEIKGPLPDTLWRAIDANNFTVFGMIPIRYPVVQTFTEPDSTLLQNIRFFVDHFNRRPSVSALGLFEFGQVSSPAFAEAIEVYLRQIQMASAADVYFGMSPMQPSLVDTLFDFKMLEYAFGHRAGRRTPDSTVQAVSYRPPGEYRRSLARLKDFMNQWTNSPRTLLFFDGSWLLDLQKRYPPLTKVFQSYVSSTGEEPVFPLPDERQPTPQAHSMAVLLLLLIWGSVAINYNTEPIYRKSFFRYFNAHKFFVSDVMDRLFRSNLPSLLILIQHSLAGGLWMYCLGKHLFSARGFEALSYYYPFLQITGDAAGSYILLGILLTSVVSLISIMWLRFLIPPITQLSQAVTLYAWPLQVNLVIVTGMVLLLVTGAGTFWMLALGLLWLLTFLGTFVFAAFETTFYSEKRRALVLAGTAGVYIAGITGMVIWIAGNAMLMNVWRLSLSLS